MRVAVILNPRSAAGRTARQWPALEARLRQCVSEVSVFPTNGPGHATELTRAALKAGHDRILSVGGDGTLSEVVNGFFEGEAQLNPEAVLGLLPCGTGSDFAKTLRLPRGEAALDVALGNSILPCDVGRITRSTSQEAGDIAHFINTCHIGVGSEVALRVNESAKRMGGFSAFLWGTLRALLSYQDCRLRITLDEEVLEQDVKEIILANGQYDGGGMHVAPFARLDNGKFDVYIVGPVSFAGALLRLHKLYRGRLHECTGVVRYATASRIRIEVIAPRRLAISPDGELAGMLPATFTVVPAALRLAASAALCVERPSRSRLDKI